MKNQFCDFTQRFWTELLNRYSLLFQKPEWWWRYWLPMWNPPVDLQLFPDSPSKPKWQRIEWSFIWPWYLNIWIPAVVLQAILVTVPPLFSVLYSGGEPVSRSRHATIAGSNAAERRGRDVGVPSTRHCSPPERYCALHQTRCHLIRVRRGHICGTWKLMNTFIQAQYSSAR